MDRPLTGTGEKTGKRRKPGFEWVSNTWKRGEARKQFVRNGEEAPIGASLTLKGSVAEPWHIQGGRERAESLETAARGTNQAILAMQARIETFDRGIRQRTIEQRLQRLMRDVVVRKGGVEILVEMWYAYPRPLANQGSLVLPRTLRRVRICFRNTKASIYNLPQPGCQSSFNTSLSASNSLDFSRMCYYHRDLGLALVQR
jgi:hypothetical protein